MNKIYIVLLTMLCSGILLAQDPTVGLLDYSQSQTYQGYILIYPHNQPDVFLLDNCGEIVHTWEGEEGFRPGNVAELLEDGRLVRTRRPAVFATDPIWAGGGGAIIDILSWEGDILWSYELNNEEARLHHDIAVTPSGTILAIAWEYISAEEAIAAGRDSALLTQGALWPDMVIELDPELDSIIWEWHSWDHIVQDRDPSKPNFGVISENQRKIDVNWDTSDGAADWHHMNSIDYNPVLDQVMLSVPTFNEIWVIDHTTTTEQAATSNGGLTNHGGDLIYRAGNPQAYQQGDSTDQLLYYQHDAHWVLNFPENHPLYGDIACFNNRVGADFSTAEVFDSPWMDYLTDYQMFQETWPPYEFENTITHPTPQNMYSTGLSSVQFLPNGNTLLCSGRQGYLFELNDEDEIVWEYITPLIAGAPVEQGTELSLNNNLTFRAYKYSEDYPAFVGRDLTPKGWIEINPLEDYCEDLISSVAATAADATLYPNPADGLVTVKWTTGMMIDISITNISGQQVIHTSGNGGTAYIDISDLHPGMYFITVDNEMSRKLIVK